MNRVALWVALIAMILVILYVLQWRGLIHF